MDSRYVTIMKIVPLLAAFLAVAAPATGWADAITDLIARQQAERAAAPDDLTPADRAECRAQAIAASANTNRQLEVQAACLEARRARQNQNRRPVARPPAP